VDEINHMTRHIIILFITFCCNVVNLSFFSASFASDSLSSSTVSKRIINGEQAQPGKWPWTVSIIQKGYSPFDGHLCAGGLIKNEWVITAAHCFYNYSGSQLLFERHIQVYAGNTNLNADGLIIDVESIIIHPDYDDDSSDNDIALLKLKTSLSQITPIDLMSPDSEFGLEGNNAVVVGWGTTDVNKSLPSADLMEVILPIVDHDLCRTIYQQDFNITVTDNMICAGYSEGGKDSCMGDSGGPLMVYDTSVERWKLAGLVSWGVGCAAADQYGVYTNAANYLDWSLTNTLIHNGDINAFVERLYQFILGRHSDPGSLEFWINEINTTSAARVSLGFFNSREFLSMDLDNNHFITILYQTLFDREYDQGGYEHWMSQLANGVLREMVIYGFFTSQEFEKLASRFNVTAFNAEDNMLYQVKRFVQRFYRLVLGREPELNGFNNWIVQLTSDAKSAGAIAREFFMSSEFTNRDLSNEEFLNTAYLAILNRYADMAGQRYWLNQLSSGVSRLEVVEGFINSQEFSDLAELYGLRAN
jgi:V8-like Glu-specific endopeptidase